MPLYMDVHNLGGPVANEDVVKAHQADLQTQAKYGVRYRRFWYDPNSGRIFCLVEAPSPQAAEGVHRDAHGLVADEIYEVIEGE
jgi:hypothetical protein